MDLVLTRTFVEVVASGSFTAAAERLNITQAAVSMRIRALEDLFGQPLFVRNKGGAVLTAPGEQFRRYAATLSSVWDQARHQLGAPEGYRTVLHIGGQLTLWDHLIRKWLPIMRHRAAHVALHAELNVPRILINQLAAGILDIGIMYTPEVRPGLGVEKLFDEDLVLVSSAARREPAQDAPDVMVDWGPEFLSMYHAAWPHHITSGISFGQGSLALNYILDNDGTAYLPRRLIEAYQRAGHLTAIENAPSFPYPAYIVYSESLNKSLLNLVVETMRKVAAEGGGQLAVLSCKHRAPNPQTSRF
jgi:DNA-binding transcriptional LysR family regulator